MSECRLEHHQNTSLSGKNILISGGTGTFGKAFTKYALQNNAKKVIIYSRDEYKQHEMHSSGYNDSRIRYQIGDVRDKERLKVAMHGVDYVIHAAAMKRITECEYNPAECIKTNVNGSQNVVDASIEKGVNKCILLSTDKSVEPAQTYGKSKALAESIFIQGNAYANATATSISAVRYGNVLGSRGSVIPIFKEQAKTGTLNVTSSAMTRFWINIENAVKFVDMALSTMHGGEIFIPKLKSCSVMTLAKAIAPNAKIKYIGIRPGEKLHELMISKEESAHTIEYDNYFIIKPLHPFWDDTSVPDGGRAMEIGEYSSGGNSDWICEDELRRII